MKATKLLIITFGFLFFVINSTAFAQTNEEQLKGHIVALEHMKAKSRKKVAEALKKITGQNFEKDYNVWLRWWKEQNIKNQ